jgi:hypothetical protein
MAAGFSFSGVKWWLYFIAWGIGLFAATYDDPSHIVAAPFFPIGLIALLPNGAQKAIIAAWLAAPAVAAVGWMLYAGVTVLIGRAKKGTPSCSCTLCCASCSPSTSPAATGRGKPRREFVRGWANRPVAMPGRVTVLVTGFR